MPVNGFPSILEHVLNHILEESRLVSYKIAGNQCESRTTLVLRFETPMADTKNALPIPFHSTPACYRRKSPSQLKRDKLRRQQYETTRTAEKITSTNNEQRNESTINSNKVAAKLSTSVNSLDPVDSAIESVASSAIPKTAPPDHSTNTTIEKEDIMCSNDSDNTSELQISCAKFKEETTRPSDTFNCEENTNTHEGTRADNVQPSSQDCTTSPHISKIIEQLDCDKIRAQIFDKIDRDTALYITQPDRNNKFLKLLLDSYGESSYYIVADTDDLIIEYSTDSQMISKFIVKNSGDESKFARMRQRHLERWKDDTLILWEHHPKHLQIIETLLPQLKLLISKVKRL